MRVEISLLKGEIAIIKSLPLLDCKRRINCNHGRGVFHSNCIPADTGVQTTTCGGVAGDGAWMG